MPLTIGEVISEITPLLTDYGVYIGAAFVVGLAGVLLKRLAKAER